MSAPKPFATTIETAGTTVIVTLTGELDLAVAGRLKDKLDALEPAAGGVLVIDLSALEFIDSSGLRVLVMTHQRAQRDGFRMVLVQGSEPVSRVLKLTRLDEQLEIVATRDSVPTG